MSRDKEQITKNQHIVPERHLKNFCILNKNRLVAFNIDELRIEKDQSPNSICRDYFHYAMYPGNYDEYSQIVEKKFGNLENWYSNNFQRIESNLLQKVIPSDEDRYGISLLVANFHFRGRIFRAEIKNSLEQVIDFLQPSLAEDFHTEMEKRYPHLFTKNDKNFTSNIIREGLYEYIQNTSYATNRSFDEGFPNTLTHKNWKILINNSNENPFITSDEAVIELIPEWASKNTVLKSYLIKTQIFHLSPRIAIICLYPFNEDEHGKTQFLDITENEKAVNGNNLQYINYAHKYAYSPNKYFFEKIIKENSVL
ncbi:MAG: DUF4238 domain-containing protein [Candidatus Yonathbacteria bacterium]|nr:DUF4238 domain-containing protein [Candidatus Yonathbacteria bacterium]NTW48009.1 DUF4238 domain-containing protein [Candidatus Yonathbacteria bacterium]